MSTVRRSFACNFKSTATGGGGGGGSGGPAVTGLLVRYSAQAETGYASGATMAGWTDLSGNAKHTTSVTTGFGGQTGPVWQSTTGPSGGAAVRFPGGGYFVLPTVRTAGQEGEVFVRIKSDGVNTSHWLFSTVNQECHYPFGADIYETFGFVGRVGGFNVPTTSWGIYNVSAGASVYDVNLNGTNLGHSTGGGWTLAWPSTPWIGCGSTTSGATPDMRFTGYMSTFLLYDHALSSADRATVNAWMTANPSGGT